jgi:hypothetical protein
MFHIWKFEFAKRYRLKCGVIGNTWEHFETWLEHQYFFSKALLSPKEKKKSLFWCIFFNYVIGDVKILIL